MKVLKGVCVGVGYFSQFHYEAWHRINGVEIVALCDVRAKEAKETAKNWGIKNIYTRFEEMIDNERPDFIDIITPPSTHLDIVKYASSKGVHIICQKPMAPTLEEAIKINEIARSANVRLMIHENFRFQPWHRTIKKMLDDELIGDELFYASFKMRLGDGWREDAYLDRQPYFRTMPRLLIYETGIHIIDVFRYLFGEIHEVYARLKRLNPVVSGEDWAFVNFEFESGQAGYLDANRYNESPFKNDRYTFGEFQIDGSGGSIRLSPSGNLTFQPLGKQEKVYPYNPSRNSFAGDCVYATQKHFIDALFTELEFETSGDHYLQNIQIQDSIYHSANSGLPVQVGRFTQKRGLKN